MRRYYEQFHTPENLAQQIEDLRESYPDMLLVGSLGRAGIFGEIDGDVMREYSHRGEDPLYHMHPMFVQHHNGPTARDIDVIGVPHEDAASRLPFWVDATSYLNDQATLIQDCGTWVLSDGRGFLEPIHPDVMEPHESETVFGINIKTLHPDTLLSLLIVRGDFRPKDALTYSLLRESANRLPSRKRLPDYMMQPFIEASTRNRLPDEDVLGLNLLKQLSGGH